MNDSSIPPICYLCGDQITDTVSRDHVPPKQFFGKILRKVHSLNLITLDSHELCNKTFQSDEEYFVHSFVPIAMRSYSGKSLLKELVGQYHGGRNVPLSQKILSEFKRRWHGLILPDKAVKHFDPDRVWRIVWKIVRGLFFIEYNRLLPEDTPKVFKIVGIDSEPPPEYQLLVNKEERGKYPGIFAYKCTNLKKMKDFHFWAMLFWDTIMVLVYFHDPNCECEDCVALRSGT